MLRWLTVDTELTLNKTNPVVLTALKRTPGLTERAESHLEELIAAGSLGPGDRLPSERELGAQLGVSKTVVREAIRSLTAKGLVEVRAGSGTYVREFNREIITGPMNFLLRSRSLGVEQIHEVRQVLEVEIAGLAAGRAKPDDLAAMEATIERLRKPEIPDIEFAKADVAFHQALADAAANPLFSILANSMNDVMIELRLWAYKHNEAAVERARYYHSWILDEVGKRDVQGARHAMEEHLAYALVMMRRAASEEKQSDQIVRK